MQHTQDHSYAPDCYRNHEDRFYECVFANEICEQKHNPGDAPTCEGSCEQLNMAAPTFLLCE